MALADTRISMYVSDPGLVTAARLPDSAVAISIIAPRFLAGKLN